MYIRRKPFIENGNIISDYLTKEGYRKVSLRKKNDKIHEFM